MDGVTISLRELLIAVVLATVIYLLEALIFAKRRRKKAAAQRIEPVVADSGAGPEAIASLRAEIGLLKARVEALERQLATQPSAQAQEDAAELSPYVRATQLARQGLSATELCARCGISRGEAELIVALHQRLE